MEIVDEYTEVRRKYWKREPKILASGRILTLCLATIAVLGYLAILIVFIARSNTIVVKNVIPTDTVPAAGEHESIKANTISTKSNTY